MKPIAQTDWTAGSARTAVPLAAGAAAIRALIKLLCEQFPQAFSGDRLVPGITNTCHGPEYGYVTQMLVISARPLSHVFAKVGTSLGHEMHTWTP